MVAPVKVDLKQVELELLDLPSCSGDVFGYH